MLHLTWWSLLNVARLAALQQKFKNQLWFDA